MTLLEHLKQRYLDQPDALTLRILLLNGDKMHAKVFKVLDDGEGGASTHPLTPALT